MTENYEELKIASTRISNGSPLSEELLHYTLDEFLRKSTLQDILDSGAGRFYCVRIMLNSWNSVTSPFYHTYRRTNVSLEEAEDVVEEEDLHTGELASKAKSLLADLPWYDRKLFETFIDENHTVSSLARATGIPRTSISLTINRVRKHLRKNL